VPSLLDIVLCYISHDPRFWGLPLMDALAFEGTIPVECAPVLHEVQT